ncbi:MAG: sigma-70 family RNA polymerase sigma factor [Actinobacteria bacterium]|nr:sigma-70 family RNA polymerase sigma factor [Actinomycetota bacterium]
MNRTREQVAAARGAEASKGAMTLGRGRAGDLFHQHSADAVRLAYLMTGDRHLAEDLAQEAFVRTFGRFQDLRRPEAFGPYLRRVVVNLCRDHFRRVTRERLFARHQRAVEGEDDVRLGQVEVRDELLHALGVLPQRQRAAIVLRHCEGLSEQETASALSTSVGAVNSLVARGLSSLREHMRGENGE